MSGWSTGSSVLGLDGFVGTLDLWLVFYEFGSRHQFSVGLSVFLDVLVDTMVGFVVNYILLVLLISSM